MTQSATASTQTTRGNRRRADFQQVVLRNGSINFAGSVLPLIIGVIALPRIIRGLGVDQFGILSFAWAVLGYFTLFDLGLGRATTKFVAEFVGRGELEKVSQFVWNSVAVSAVMGLAGTIVLSSVTHLLVTHVLAVNPKLAPDAMRVFFVLAATLPAVVVSNTLRGVLEAHQRFGLVNSVTVPVNAAMFALPAVGAVVGLGLPAIALLLAASRFAAVVAFAVLCLVNIAALRQMPRYDTGAIRSLMSYGGWVTISNVVGPSLTYLDRFAIGATLSTAAVGYYTAPFEAVTRLWIFPSSIVGALFPAFSASASRGAADEVGELAATSIKYLLVVVSPIVTVLVAFAPQILGLWLGSDFVSRSSVVFQALAIGVLVNSVAFVPFSLLQALGRADLPPKLYAVEFVVYAPLLIVLLTRFGIAGAGVAWTMRVMLDCLLLCAACWKIYPDFLLSARRYGIVSALFATSGLAVTTTVAKVALNGRLGLQLFAAAFALTVFAVVAWRSVLDHADRQRLLVAVGVSRL